MKRLILTTTGTVAGLAALLSFKTQGHPLANAGPLPSAGTPVTSTGTGSTPSGSTPSGSTTSGTKAGTTAGTKAGATHSTTSGGTARTYVGQAVTTRYGIVQVKATVAAGRITDVGFVQLSAFDGHSQQINSYAGPQLLQETLQKQTAQVDTVSGASYTSAGYRQSMQSALDQAGLK